MERNNLNLLLLFQQGDIIGLALDLDNGTLSFYDDDNGLIGTIPFDKTKSACFGAMSKHLLLLFGTLVTTLYLMVQKQQVVMLMRW